METTEKKNRYLPLWLMLIFVIVMLYPLCLRIISPMIYDDDKNSWLRLFSIIAPLFIGGAFIWFGHRIKHVFLGLITALICTLSNGVSTFHINVQGDYEACLVLFVVLYLVSYMIMFYINEGAKKEKKPWEFYLCIFFVSLALGIIAKSWQALLPLLFLLIWTIIKSYKKDLPAYKTVTTIFTTPFTYIGIVICLLLIGVYNFALIGTYISSPESIATIPVTDSFNFRYFIFFFPVALIYNFFIKDEKIRNLFLFSLCGGIFYLLVIYLIIPKAGYSSSLAIPFFALIEGICLEDVFKRIYAKEGGFFKALPFILGVIFFIYPYSSVISKNKNTFDLAPMYETTDYDNQNQLTDQYNKEPNQFEKGVKDRTKELANKALDNDSSNNIIDDIHSMREKEKQMNEDRKQIQEGISSANKTLDKLREKFDLSTFFENLKNIVLDFLGIDNGQVPTKENIEKIYKENAVRHHRRHPAAPQPQAVEQQEAPKEEPSVPQADKPAQSTSEQPTTENK